MLLEKICGLELPSPLAGTGECTSPPPRCQLLRKFRYQLTAAVDYSGSRDRPQPGRPHCYSSLARAAQPAVQIRVMARFPKIPYRSGTSRNDPAAGPIPPISVPRRHRTNECLSRVDNCFRRGSSADDADGTQMKTVPHLRSICVICG